MVSPFNPSLFREDLSALSRYLGEKAFLLGPEPCLADLTLFGFVLCLTELPEESEDAFKKHVMRGLPNLVEHQKRFRRNNSNIFASLVSLKLLSSLTAG